MRAGWTEAEGSEIIGVKDSWRGIDLAKEAQWERQNGSKNREIRNCKIVYSCFVDNHAQLSPDWIVFGIFERFEPSNEDRMEATKAESCQIKEQISDAQIYLQ